MTRITITLTEEDKAALQILSKKEFRDPQSQAALIIHRELEKQRLIEEPASASQNSMGGKRIVDGSR